MDFRASTVVLAVILSAGCAATTPPPRFGPVSPADPDAPEAAPPPAAPSLTGTAASAPAAAATYSCPHHPEVRQASPGSCPRCGATLERRQVKEQP